MTHTEMNSMNKLSTKALFALMSALLTAVLAIPLASCGSKPAADGAATPEGTATQPAAVDTSSWKTLSDALATQTESMASSWDSKHYVTVFKAGDSYVRVVVELTDEESKKMEAVDWSQDNVGDQIAKAAGSAKIVTAEDITAEILDQNALNNLVGKTGKDLIADGWVFESYFMYGGEQTGATMSKGNFGYNITFDVTTPESATEDGGASIMDATVIEAGFSGASNAATDISQIS